MSSSPSNSVFDASYSTTSEKFHKIDEFIKNDLTASGVADFYNKWASSYEQDLSSFDGGYHNPTQIANCLARFVSDKAVRILDVACGTGLVALQLRQRGYLKIDGLDGSEQMLEIAKKHGLYERYFCELVGAERMASVDDGSYDCVVTTGSFMPGHMDATCLRTIGRTVRTGGFVFICHRTAILEHPELRDISSTMRALEEEGFWKLEHRADFDNYYNNMPGVEYAFLKL